MAVVAAYVDHAVANRRKGNHVIPGLKPPFLLTGLRVQSVDIPVKATEDDGLPHNRRASIHPISSLEPPDLLPGCGVHRVKILVAAAEVDQPIHQRRRRLDPDIGGENL